MSPRPTPTVASAGCLALAAAGLAATAAVAPAAYAAKGGTCRPFTVITAGTTYSGEQDRTIPASAVGRTLLVRGRYVRFTIRSTSFAVHDYTLTGNDSPRADKNLPLDGPTVVFASKAPDHGKVLTSGVDLRIDADGIVAERQGGGQSMKIQAKNCAQGGIFQMEPEPGTTFTHTLGPDFGYDGFGAPGSGRLCITNGDFAAYESPELATLVSPADGTGTTSTWSVRSGGRMGYVVGEDAVEGGCRA